MRRAVSSASPRPHSASTFPCRRSRRQTKATETAALVKAPTPHRGAENRSLSPEVKPDQPLVFTLCSSVPAVVKILILTCGAKLAGRIHHAKRPLFPTPSSNHVNRQSCHQNYGGIPYFLLPVHAVEQNK